MSQIETHNDAFKVVREVMIPMFYKETQLARSIRNISKQEKLEFKKELFKAILELADRVDKSTLKNNHVREKIKNLSDNTSGTIGQAQKVINVYLKYYSILTGKKNELLRELDCPLDSKVMSRYERQLGLKRMSLKNMDDMHTYETWQNGLKKTGRGLRISPDLQTYDPERIREYLTKM